jgi:hypothetical protein
MFEQAGPNDSLHVVRVQAAVLIVFRLIEMRACLDLRKVKVPSPSGSTVLTRAP